MEESSSSEGTLKIEGNNGVSGESGRKSRSGDGKMSNRSENVSEKSSAGSSTLEKNSSKQQSARSAEDKVSSERRRRKKHVDPKFLKYYPNVPGIGPRLSAEEVACVAIWMSECARVQEGMVGPRNLRHMNCPPLDRQQTS